MEFNLSKLHFSKVKSSERSFLFLEDLKSLKSFKSVGFHFDFLMRIVGFQTIKCKVTKVLTMTENCLSFALTADIE